jgi:multicomponent Na+:H+ antiporter subunit F
MRQVRYIIGLIALAIVFGLIIFHPTPSLLAWQSALLRRVFSVLMLCGLFCLWRILRGPTPADRAVALDILGILILGFCAILGVPTGRDWYIDIGIAWALQSFICVLALGKYLERKGFDE